MVDLKKDLDQYLLLQSDQKKKTPTFHQLLPNTNLLQNNSRLKAISTWFGGRQQEDNHNEDDSTWFQETTKECCPSLTRFRRITLFCLCMAMGIICFSLSLMYVPVLLFKARKFSLLFTLGSLFFVLSFFFLWGPTAYLKHMFSKERLLLTISYWTTLIATLYCALHLQSTPFTVLCAICQIITLLWTVIANVPGGASGISLFSRIFSRSLSGGGGSLLPI